MKMAVVCDVAPCSLAGALCLHYQEAVNTCEKSVNFCDTSRHMTTEDIHLQAHVMFVYTEQLSVHVLLFIPAVMGSC
jgi:hypothetical protein